MPHSDTPSPVVFLFDVDNTLLDNDAVVADLRAHLERELGTDGRDNYFRAFESIRSELGYADYLGALQRYRAAYADDQRIGHISRFLIEYPFGQRVFPGALEAVARCAEVGTVVVLTDGDVVFQPWKILKAGIERAFGGRVLIYVHKEEMLEDVRRRYPAARYVLVDDKVRILDAVKKQWGEDVVTVFPRQGHYATDAASVARYPKPDVTIERVGELAGMDVAAMARL